MKNHIMFSALRIPGPGTAPNIFGPQVGNVLFSSISTTGGAPLRGEAERPGIPSHTINGETWISAEGIADEFGPDISATEDILAPVAAMNLDNTRAYTAYETTHFVSAHAFAQRLRMNDRGRNFISEIIKKFLTNAIGIENITFSAKFGSKWCVDIYVPRANLVIDISSPQLQAEVSKINYLHDRLGIRHIEFVCSPPARAPRGAFAEAVPILRESDIRRLLDDTIPSIFSHIFAQFSTGDINQSATVNRYISSGAKREYDAAAEGVLPPSKRRSTVLSERPHY